MIRGYICDNDECAITFEVEQHRDDPRKKKCPACGKFSLYQDLSGIYVGVREVKTIGQLAELNTKKLGRYGLESKEEEEYQKQKDLYNKKKAMIEKSIPNAKVPEFGQKDPIPETPSYVKKAIAAQPNGKAKIERTNKYIFEGK